MASAAAARQKTADSRNQPRPRNAGAAEVFPEIRTPAPASARSTAVRSGRLAVISNEHELA